MIHQTGIKNKVSGHLHGSEAPKLPERGPALILGGIYFSTASKPVRVQRKSPPPLADRNRYITGMFRMCFTFRRRRDKSLRSTRARVSTRRTTRPTLRGKRDVCFGHSIYDFSGFDRTSSRIIFVEK